MDPIEPLFSSEVLSSIIGGASAVDIPRMRLHDREEALDFLHCYGFSWSEPSHRDELERIRQTALRFIETALLEPGESMPEALREETDLPALLLAASRPPDRAQRWRCALLRVMHAIAHAYSPLERRYGDQIRGQILGRFHEHLFGEDGALMLGSGPDAIPLADFGFKSSKTLRSTTMKLLHKAENVAADVFDRIGVRFVTRSRFDAMLVVRYLRTHNVMMFANVKPTRSRNTLVDLEHLQTCTAALDREVVAGRLAPDERTARLRAMVEARPCPSPRAAPDNQFSLINYRSIQYTCRQLIRVREPSASGGEVQFFFPFEIQILDVESYAEARSGLASHEVYKARQRAAVRRRVLGALIEDEALGPMAPS